MFMLWLCWQLQRCTLKKIGLTNQKENPLTLMYIYVILLAKSSVVTAKKFSRAVTLNLVLLLIFRTYDWLHNI